MHFSRGKGKQLAEKAPLPRRFLKAPLIVLSTQLCSAEVQVSSYEQHLSEAQAASFQALQDQLHSFQNEMAAAALLRTQLVDKDRQIDTIR